MKEFLLFFLNIAQSAELLLAIILISVLVKIMFLVKLVPHGLKKETIHASLVLIIGTIIGALFGDIAWIFKLGREIFVPDFSYQFITFFIRIAWALLLVQYQALSLFVYSLTNKKFYLTLINKITIFCSSVFSGYFIFISLFHWNYLCDEMERQLALEQVVFFEQKVMKLAVFYLIFVLSIPAFFTIMKKLRNAQVPKILAQQLKLFTAFFIGPYFVTEFILGFCISSINNPESRPILAFSTVLLVGALYYCMKKIMGLRFLNSSDHVIAPPKTNVLEEFKTVLEQLSSSSSMQELSHITQTFFKESFSISHRSVFFVIHDWNEPHYKGSKHTALEHHIEKFLDSCNKNIHDDLRENSILLFDEISFDTFYQESEIQNRYISFLNSINADIFMPIYLKQKIIAYVVVTRNARSLCYSKAERDAMLVFGNYLSNIINILQHNNLEALIHKEKELKEQLYHRHQEINQYKESIKSFLRKQKSIGILFYKNNQFLFGNQEAEELIKVNINEQEGHPLSKAIRHVAQQVESFKAPYSDIARDDDGNMLILSGVPHLHQNSVIITVVYPEISDIISRQIDQLINPNNWDYVLYLESTTAGNHINQLIPGTGEKLLNFKVELLKAALSKQALLLDLPDQDIIPTVERIHHISLRESLHCIELHHQTKTDSIAPKLFGINPIFCDNDAPTPLLKLLQNNGTLLLKNVHFLDIETQNYLADYINYGYYQLYKSEQKIQSNAHIICSTSQNIPQLVQDGTCSFKLSTSLKTVLSMPSLSEIHMHELYSLIDGFTEQALKTHTFKNMLSLSEKEKDKILLTIPTSLHELRSKVQQALMKKSKEHNMQTEVHFDPAYNVSDPELIQAARLGKQALKDQKMLALLWQKFKNQNKIALFLGVNRSSVHRRCKAYNIGSGEEKVA